MAYYIPFPLFSTVRCRPSRELKKFCRSNAIKLDSPPPDPFLWESAPPHLPDADTLVDATERLEDEQASVLDEVLQTGNQEEVIHQHLRERPKRIE